MKKLINYFTEKPERLFKTGASVVLATCLTCLGLLRHENHKLVDSWWYTATNTVPSLLQAGKMDEAWKLYYKTWESISENKSLFYKEGITAEERIDELAEVFNRPYLSSTYTSTNTEPSAVEMARKILRR